MCAKYHSNLSSLDYYDGDFFCEQCGKPIEVGTHVYKLAGYNFCEKCVENSAEYVEGDDEESEVDAMDVWKRATEQAMCDEINDKRGV